MWIANAFTKPSMRGKNKWINSLRRSRAMSSATHKALVSDENLTRFLESIKVVIFDSSNSSKNMIIAAFKDMGMPIRNILPTKSYESAREIIRTEKPQMCVSEYEVRGRYGLDLLYELKEFIPEPIFVLATSTASETSIAEAAEEDVDAYIVKPFMGDHLSHYLRQAIEYRIDPPPYIAKIKLGKKAFDSNDVATAKRLFLKLLL
jgi:two-component system chemotaxis response regulator CheY